jgi:Flp pilus assembly protein TadG
MRSLLSRNAQRGAVAVLVAIAMGALILTAGLALDMGHAFLNKTRLQNTVDAAALAAASRLDETGDTGLATTSAMAAFTRNAGASGNSELSAAYAGGRGIQVVVEYSQTLPPFNAGAANGPYVRVRATGFVMPAWLVRVGGIFEKTVSATAVAGPRTMNSGSTVCNVAPMMVCGDAGSPGWGYTQNEPVVLKKATPGGQSQVGPGNFQLIQIGGQGADIVRDNMAGRYDTCIAGGSTIQTETGNETGPVAQGLNTRFGQYDGPMHNTQSTYPPDVIVDTQNPALEARQVDERDASRGYHVYQGNTRITSTNINVLYNFQDYTADLANPALYDYSPTQGTPRGAFGRRVVSVPVGDCTGTSRGSGSVPLLGFACFFLLQPVVQQGNNAFVFGQFINDCTVDGTPGPNPVAGNGPHIIQLYDDPNSNDS